MPTVRILLDHSGYRTIGDWAQTLTAVASLRAALPGCHVSTRHYPWEPAMAFGQDDQYVSPGVEIEPEGRFILKLSARRGMSRLAQALLAIRRTATVSGVLWGAWTKRHLRVTLLPPGHKRRFVERLAQADLFAISGGGAINDTFAVNGVLNYGAQVLCARLLGKPVALVGQGIGPLRAGWSRRLARCFLRRADYITLREAISESLLRELGIPAERHELGVDDAHPFAVGADAAREVEAFLAPLPRPIISLNMRFKSYVDTPGGFPDVLARAANAAVERTGGCVLCVPMLTEAERDLAAYREFAGKLSHRDRVVLLPSALARPEPVKAVQQRVDLAVGCTYHFLLFALSSDRPALGIHFNEYYRQKLGGLLEQYGLPGGVFAGAGLSAEALSARMIEILNDPSAIRAALQRRNAELLERHRRTYARVAALLRDRLPVR